MNKHFVLAVILALTAPQTAPPAFAQDDQAPTAATGETAKAGDEEAPASSSQEVEINEDTYRQFMELKDARQQRDIIPETAFKPESGLQKLENLPEESQKHLRNELREIIVDGEPWQPGDENADYPYLPSDAARNDPALQKQELEAWGELVDSYNQREAQIYANSAESRGAMSSTGGGDNNPGNGENADADGGRQEVGKDGLQASQESSSDQSDSAGTYSPNAPNDPNARNTAGVSQNAMEFLQGLGKGGAYAGNGAPAEPQGSGGQAGSPASAAINGQAQVQGESRAQSNTGSGTPNPSADPDDKSTAGTAQNALEFLKGAAGQSQSTGESDTGSSSTAASEGENRQASTDSTQADGDADGQEKAQADAQGDGEDAGQVDSRSEEQSQATQQTETAQQTPPGGSPAETSPVPPVEPEEESTEGASQNAFEYLTGESAGTGTDNAAATTAPEGTLNIQDLLNAQGVGTTIDTAATPSGADQKQNTGSNPPNDDDGGL